MDDISTGGGAAVGGNASTGGGDFTGRDDRSINVYPPPPATPDNFGWWLGDIREKLITLRVEQGQRLERIESEMRAQDRHLGKLTGDVAELKELRHTVFDLRHVMSDLARQVNQLMQMEPELREDFSRDLRDLREGFTFHFTLLWLVNAILIAGVAWAVFVK